MIDVPVALLAGALTTLSPCVLPLLPFVLASAAAQHRFGPIALAGGIGVGFMALGLAVFGLGAAFEVGFGRTTVRLISATVLILFGVVLLSAALQQRFALVGARAVSGLNPVLERFSLQGFSGQFVLGLLLGVIWTPCSGPTLGAAIGLASNSDTLGQSAWVLLFFSLGTSLPLLALAYGSRQALQSRRALLSRWGRASKSALGVMLIAIGALVAFGLDKILEARLVDIMPDWLTDLTTRF